MLVFTLRVYHKYEFLCEEILIGHHTKKKHLLQEVSGRYKYAFYNKYCRIRLGHFSEKVHVNLGILNTLECACLKGPLIT